MKKVVAFIGSPNPKGNTAAIVNRIIKGAEKSGMAAKIYYLNDMNIKFCQGCMYCKKEDGVCKIEDDMQLIYKDFKEADAIIIGSPIYTHQVSAQTKIFFDRLFALVDMNIKPRFHKKITVMVYSQARANKDAFQSYFDVNANLFKELGLILKDTIIYAGVDKEKKEEILAYAYGVGEALLK
jgi:multimeric flavodoxin WrbA